MPDLHILEQFVTFYHIGTLSEAAERLHISQSTLTRSMQKLEAEFAVPLFLRTKNSIALTEAGKIAAADAELILRQCETMISRVRDFDRRSRTILIGACAPVPVTGVTERLTGLFPSATISSELKGIPALLAGLSDQTYQLIILPYAPETPGLSSAALCSEQLFFFLHRKHRFARRKSLSIAEMNGENMLLFQDIGFWYDLVTEKMPDSRFLVQSERYSFVELIRNSTMPAFSTNAASFAQPVADRVQIAIADPEFHVTYHLVCLDENRGRFREVFSDYFSHPRQSLH